MAGSTVKERLSILDDNDLEGDPLVEGVVREYSFVIYDEVSCFCIFRHDDDNHGDIMFAHSIYTTNNTQLQLHQLHLSTKQGGDGLCCTNGEGSYALYNKGKLLFIGNAFGTSKEHSIRIDPADFLESESSNTADNTAGASVIESSPADGTNNDAQATWNTPTTPPPSTALTSVPVGPTTSPVPTVKPVSPTAQLAVDQERWYCGSSWDWVIRNCAEAIPCRGGDASGTLYCSVFACRLGCHQQCTHLLLAPSYTVQSVLQILHALRVLHALLNRRMLPVTAHQQCPGQ